MKKFHKSTIERSLYASFVFGQRIVEFSFFMGGLVLLVAFVVHADVDVIVNDKISVPYVKNGLFSVYCFIKTSIHRSSPLARQLTRSCTLAFQNFKLIVRIINICWIKKEIAKHDRISTPTLIHSHTKQIEQWYILKTIKLIEWASRESSVHRLSIQSTHKQFTTFIYSSSMVSLA